MTGFHFTAPTLFALQAAAWPCGGALIGAAYFWMLRWNAALLASGRAPLVAVVQVVRFLLLAGLLATIADRCGALPLLLATAGIVVARTIMTTRFGVWA
jgi:N-ATPase, AtpR subunit